MAEHTAEWHYIGDEDGDFVVYAGEQFITNIGQAVQAVSMNPKTELIAFDVDQANARLIAAAPELLTALEGLVECLEDGVFDEAYADLMRERGRTAIAKARGDQV